jgi:hypothetical protein
MIFFSFLAARGQKAIKKAEIKTTIREGIIREERIRDEEFTQQRMREVD